jgi:hypothetical protein
MEVQNRGGPEPGTRPRCHHLNLRSRVMGRRPVFTQIQHRSRQPGSLSPTQRPTSSASSSPPAPQPLCTMLDSSTGHRERRPWTEEEDRLLREAIQRGALAHGGPVSAGPPPTPPRSARAYSRRHLSQRTRTPTHRRNGMLSRPMSPTAPTRTAASDGGLRWPPPSPKVAGPPRKTTASVPPSRNSAPSKSTLSSNDLERRSSCLSQMGPRRHPCTDAEQRS